MMFISVYILCCEFIVNNYDVEGSVLQGQMCPAVPVFAL